MVFVWALVNDRRHDGHRTSSSSTRFSSRRPHPVARVKLEVAAVGKDYLIPVIDSVSFAAEAGDFVCLLGPKRLRQDHAAADRRGIEPATRGRVTLDGHAVIADASGTCERSASSSRKTAAALDDPARQRRPRPHAARSRRGRARGDGGPLSQAGRSRRLRGLLPGRVSGGMRQRAAIAARWPSSPTCC